MSSLKKLVMMANQIDDQPALPDGFIELEYLENSGTQYINLPITWNEVMDFIVEAQVTSLNSPNRAVLGSSTSASPTACWGYYSGSIREWQWSTGVSPLKRITANIQLSHNQAGNVQGADGNIYIHETGEDIKTALNTFAPVNSVVLFRSGTDRYSLGRIFSLSFNNGDKNYIPALRVSDSKPGMYDLISGQFFTNQGTGEFTYKIKE